MIRLPSPEQCPKCGSVENEIIRTRIADGGFRYRRRKCRNPECLRRWNTYETVIPPRRLRLVQPSVPPPLEPVPATPPLPEPPRKFVPLSEYRLLCV